MTKQKEFKNEVEELDFEEVVDEKKEENSIGYLDATIDPKFAEKQKAVEKTVIVSKEVNEPSQFLSGYDLVAEKALSFAGYLMKKKLVPTTFTTEHQVYMAVQTAVALGFRKYGDINLAIGQMYILPSQGKVMLYGELPIAVVRASGKLDWMEEFFVDEEGNKIELKNKNLASRPYSAVCLVKRKNEAKIHEFILTIDDLKASGINIDADFRFSDSKKLGVWSKYPKVMWTRRCRSRALKMLFPDVLLGAAISADNSPLEQQKVENQEKLESFKNKMKEAK